MDVSSVVEQVQQVAAVRAAESAGRDSLEAALRDVGRLESWLAGTKAALTSALSAQVPFPEKAIAECTRDTTRDAINDKARADTLEAAPSLADALDSSWPPSSTRPSTRCSPNRPPAPVRPTRSTSNAILAHWRWRP